MAGVLTRRAHGTEIMIQGERVVALIPARAGSKSIPHKNLALLGGKPLLTRAVDIARAVPEIDRVIVSSDGDAILAAAAAAGAEAWRRPDHLATDAALVNDTIQDVIARLRAEADHADVMILLEPTCPLRSVQDVRGCLHKLIEEQLDSVTTFKEATLNPHRAWRLENGVPVSYMEGATPWLPRQKLPPAYQASGSVYAFRLSTMPLNTHSLIYGATGGIVVPRERSVDIDEPIDLIMANAMLRASPPADG